MLDRKTLERQGGWEGYRLKEVIWPDGETGTVELHLEPTRKVMICSGCGKRCKRTDGTGTQVRLKYALR